jgi:hypothetical protein|nr:MAG TPA: hypothetical protein [Caudoviricetes sp.]
MGKWFGKIGYAVTAETELGLWEEQIIERDYYGDMTSDRRKRQNSQGVNDDLSLSNVISIIADPFAYENCSHMAYAEIMGAKWKISDIEVQYPRLILTIGGVYNGDQT